MASATVEQPQLADMPQSAPSLLRLESQGQTVVMAGGRTVLCYDSDDIGMRNMAVVALTDAGVAGLRAAELFGLTPEYVSMLRGRARAHGSAGLVRRRGRPPKLSARQIGQARQWAAQSVPQTEIAARLRTRRAGPRAGTAGSYRRRRA